MREKADIEDAFLKLAHDLAEALTRANLNGTEYAVCFWVMCRTYGTRRMVVRKFVPLKFAAYTHSKIAKDTGRSRSTVIQALEDLLAKSVLTTNDRGLIGFNTALSGWRRDVIRGNDMGLWKAKKKPVDNLGITNTPPVATATPPCRYSDTPLSLQRHPPVATATPPSYARAEESWRVRREKTESAPTPGANSSRPQNFCAYKDRGQGQCRDAAEPSSKFCAPHGFKVTEKSLNPRAEGKPEGLVSAADAVKEMGFGQGRTDGRG